MSHIASVRYLGFACWPWAQLRRLRINASTSPSEAVESIW